MKRIYSLLFLAVYVVATPVRAMEKQKALNKTHVLDKVPYICSRLLVDAPKLFSIQHQLHAYGIPSDDGDGYEQLEPKMRSEILHLFVKADIKAEDFFIMQLDPKHTKDEQGFVVTNAGIFIDQNWWQNITEEKEYYTALMVERYKTSYYTKRMASKMVVDGVVVTGFISALINLGPSACEWLAQNVPGASWLETISTNVTSASTAICQKTNVPRLCSWVGQSVWSYALAPAVGIGMRALVHTPLKKYLKQQSEIKAIKMLQNKSSSA